MKKVLAFLFLLLLLLAGWIGYHTLNFSSMQLAEPKPRIIYPEDTAAVSKLCGFIRIPTVSFDDRSLIDTSAFSKAIAYLETQYPLPSGFTRNRIGSYALLYTWQGKNAQMAPAIVYAHYDVVPVPENEISKWKHPPFDGVVADRQIWGRGAIDDKGSLIALLEAAMNLSRKGFTPERTIYFAFGHDEEIGGNEGAASIAAHLKQQGIRADLYLDEGGLISIGMVPGVKRPVGLVGTAEKGYVTARLEINIPGGHSSRPSKNSAPEVLAKAIARINDLQFDQKITVPVEEFMRFCGPEAVMPLKMAFANPTVFRPLITHEFEKSDEGKAMLRTTAVTTIIQTGIKENVVPGKATALVNLRILPSQTSEEVLEILKKSIGDDRVKLSVEGVPFEPSPASHASGENFRKIAKALQGSSPDAAISPYLMLGSTDSKHFVSVCKETFRFLPVRMDKELLSTFHGNNERLGIQEFMESIRFYELLLEQL